MQVPAVSTVSRAPNRYHPIAPQPPRQAAARLRFERPLADDLWQIDATRVPLAAGEHGWVIDVLDDHARYLLAIRSGAQATGELAWECFIAAAGSHGMPRQLLSDNGMIFTGRLLPLILMTVARRSGRSSIAAARVSRGTGVSSSLRSPA